MNRSYIKLLNRIIFIAGGVCLFTYVTLSIKSDQAQLDREIIAPIDLSLEGIIIEKRETSDNRGFVFVDVIESNYDTFGLNYKSNSFYCKQIEGDAIIALGWIADIEIGDSISVSGTNKTNSFYRNGDLVEVSKIQLYSLDIFWENVNQLLPSKWKIKTKNSIKKH